MQNVAPDGAWWRKCKSLDLIWQFGLDLVGQRAGRARGSAHPIRRAVLPPPASALKAFYSDIGRPSVDPELMTRMLAGRLLLWHSS